MLGNPVANSSFAQINQRVKTLESIRDAVFNLTRPFLFAVGGTFAGIIEQFPFGGMKPVTTPAGIWSWNFMLFNLFSSLGGASLFTTIIGTLTAIINAIFERRGLSSEEIAQLNLFSVRKLIPRTFTQSTFTFFIYNIILTLINIALESQGTSDEFSEKMSTLLAYEVTAFLTTTFFAQSAQTLGLPAVDTEFFWQVEFAFTGMAMGVDLANTLNTHTDSSTTQKWINATVPPIVGALGAGTVAVSVWAMKGIAWCWSKRNPADNAELQPIAQEAINGGDEGHNSDFEF